MNIPTTSTTLLRDIAQDSQNARWSEFVARYRPMMEAFLRERFPSIEADDIIQETLAALCKVLPDYQYAPDEKGRFNNYLTGILRNKAIRVLRKRMSDCEKLVEYADFGRAASMKPSCGRDALVASDGRAGCLQSAASMRLPRSRRSRAREGNRFAIRRTSNFKP